MEQNTSSRKARIRKNTLGLFYWTISWVLTTALVSFGAKYLWNFNTVISSVALLLNVGVGIGMIYANIRHLKDLDELDQKIQLDAMALSLGGGIVGGIAYSMLDITNLIPGDAEISWLIVLMSAVYIIAVLVGRKRYQ